MIFVVEDDHGVRELELYALRQSGYEAEGYETPTAFRQALEKTVPDCVLLDVMLPGEDGLSLLRFLPDGARGQSCHTRSAAGRRVGHRLLRRHAHD